MKRFLSFILICFFVVNAFCFDSQAEEDEFAGWDVPGVYPIDVYDEDWKNMTFAEQLEAVALPEELVDSLSTEELADWVLAYPFLGDLCLHDSAKSSMDYFFRTSYLFRSFFAREDANEVLLKRYDDLQVDYEIIADRDANVSDRYTISGYWKELFLQCYFSTVIGDLSINEKVILKDILEEKYNEKVGICDNILTVTYLTPNNVHFSTINSISPYNRKHERRDRSGETVDGQEQSRQKAVR